jgi:glutaredoxin-dependent peroxiredoxin
MPIRPGDQAPDATVFTGPRQPAQLRQLMDGPSVLLFYPLAFTSVCTEELCTVADDYSGWTGLGARVFGISVDSPYVNARFARECRATFPLLSDFNREAATAYHVLRPELNGLQGVSERAAFVVDGAGVVRYAWVGEHPGLMPPFDQIREALRSLAAAA